MSLADHGVGIGRVTRSDAELAGVPFHGRNDDADRVPGRETAVAAEARRWEAIGVAPAAEHDDEPPAHGGAAPQIDALETVAPDDTGPAPAVPAAAGGGGAGKPSREPSTVGAAAPEAGLGELRGARPDKIGLLFGQVRTSANKEVGQTRGKLQADPPKQMSTGTIAAKNGGPKGAADPKAGAKPKAGGDVKSPADQTAAKGTKGAADPADPKKGADARTADQKTATDPKEAAAGATAAIQDAKATAGANPTGAPVPTGSPAPAANQALPGAPTNADVATTAATGGPTATMNGPTANGPTANGPTANGPTANGPTANGPTANGPSPKMTMGLQAFTPAGTATKVDSAASTGAEQVDPQAGTEKKPGTTKSGITKPGMATPAGTGAVDTQVGSTASASTGAKTNGELTPTAEPKAGTGANSGADSGVVPATVGVPGQGAVPGEEREENKQVQAPGPVAPQVVAAAAPPSAPPAGQAAPSAPPVEQAQASAPEAPKVSEADGQQMTASLDGLPTNVPAAAPPATPAGGIAATGDAKASTGKERSKLDATLVGLEAQGRADCAIAMGEDHIETRLAPEELTAASLTAGAPPVVPPLPTLEGAAPSEEVGIIAREQHGAEIDAALAKASTDVTTERSKHAQEEARARAESDAQLRELKTKADAQHREVQASTKAAVQDSRQQWQAEIDKQGSEARKQADKKVAAGMEKVKAEETRANAEARQHLEDGQRQAEEERRKGEQEAEQTKENGKKESGGFFGWLASKAKAAFDGIKRAVSAVLDACRQVVKAVLDAARNLAMAAIDLARKAITETIKLVGEAVSAIGGALLAAFPEMKAKFQNAIRSAVDTAVATVDQIADGLKAGVQQALDALGAALDKALQLFEQALHAIIDVASSVVQGAIKAAQAIAETLGSWITIIKDVATGPGAWIGKLGESIVDGIQNHLWSALKTTVTEWFKSKVMELLGVSGIILQLLLEGGLTQDSITQMALDALIVAIPAALIAILIEKLVSMIVPAAGAVMAIIEGLQAAWGTISRIIAAFGAFIAFLAMVKSGGAGPLFAGVIASSAVVVLDFVSNWLLRRLAGPARKVGARLKGMAEKFKAKGKGKGGTSKASANKPGATSTKPAKDSKPSETPKNGKPGDGKPAEAKGKTDKDRQKEKDKQEKDKDKKDKNAAPTVAHFTMHGEAHKLIVKAGPKGFVDMASKRERLSVKVGHAVGKLVAKKAPADQISDLKAIGAAARTADRAVAAAKPGDKPSTSNIPQQIAAYGAKWQVHDLHEVANEGARAPIVVTGDMQGVPHKLTVDLAKGEIRLASVEADALKKVDDAIAKVAAMTAPQNDKAAAQADLRAIRATLQSLRGMVSRRDTAAKAGTDKADPSGVNLMKSKADDVMAALKAYGTKYKVKDINIDLPTFDAEDEYEKLAKEEGTERVNLAIIAWQEQVAGAGFKEDTVEVWKDWTVSDRTAIATPAISVLKKEAIKAKADLKQKIRPLFTTDGPPKRAFHKAAGDVAATQAKQSGLAKVKKPESTTEINNKTAYVADSNYGKVQTPKGKETVDPKLQNAVESAGGIVPFMTGMATVKAAGGMTYAEFVTAWGNQTNVDYLKDKFRAVDPAKHEWIPSNLIADVIARAHKPQHAVNAVGWVRLHNELRCDTTQVIFSPKYATGKKTVGGVEHKVLCGHSGALYVETDKTIEPSTEKQNIWHNELRAVFDGATSISRCINALEQKFADTVWNGTDALPGDIYKKYMSSDGTQIDFSTLAATQAARYKAVKAVFAQVRTALAPYG
jgi:hypothetical protein